MIYVFLFLLGLCMGSFVNALVWRLHKQETSKSKKYNILTGRSMCPSCGHVLSWYDLLPVISWVSLRRRCRYCKKAISWQYPLIELLMAILFVISYIFWPVEITQLWQYINFFTWLVALVALVALALYDLKWMVLPDKITKPVFVFVALSLIVQVSLGRPLKDVWLAVLSVAIGGGIFFILYQFSNGKWIGGGDVKLGSLIGLILASPGQSFLYIFIASLIGTIFALPQLLSNKLKLTSKLPFGPFMIISAIVVVLFGPQIINWYLNLILIK